MGNYDRLMEIDDELYDKMPEILEGILTDSFISAEEDFTEYSPATFYSPAEGGYDVDWNFGFEKRLLEEITGIENLTEWEIKEIFKEALMDFEDWELTQDMLSSCRYAQLYGPEYEVKLKGNNIEFRMYNTGFEGDGF